MPNLSQIKRERLLNFLNDIRKLHNDDASLMAINEIEAELTSKKYGLVWEEHEECVDIEMKNNVPVFTEVSDKEIVSDESLPYNFVLEGDNLHSLKLLEKTHKGKIDVIYIDPPYNTGNKDFIYDDDYIDLEDSFRHSKWLSFMDKRLRIARDLLSDQGAIFIQINDIEVAQLKMLCDDIFGESNFLNIISVNMKNIAGASGGGEDKKFKKNCEYILIYAKNYDYLPLFKGAYELFRMSELVKQYKDENRSWKYTSVLINKGEKEYITSTVDGDGNEIKIFKRIGLKSMSVPQYAKKLGVTEDDVYDYHADKIYRTTMPQSSIRPRVIERMKEIGQLEEIISIEYVPKTGKNKNQIYEQFYSGEKYNLFAWLADVTENIDGVAYKKDLQGTYWNFVAGTKNLTKEGNIEFSKGKKPVDLLKRIINLYPKNDICVLDFFAGSGTTAHAVISQNQEDGGKRTFIMCTNNEVGLKKEEEFKKAHNISDKDLKKIKQKNNTEIWIKYCEENGICSSITYPRIFNVIHGYGKYNGIPANLKYYKTDFIAKSSDDPEYSMNDELLKHIKEMVQLEYAVNLDGTNYILIMSDEEADSIIADKDKLNNCKAIYISAAVLLTAEQQRELTDREISLYVIPDYYFETELLEVGER